MQLILQTTGVTVKNEDVARLSPLGFEHVNLWGRYQFNVDEQVGQGKLRPLRILQQEQESSPL